MEVANAEKTGADISLIESKYAQIREKREKELVNAKLQMTADIAGQISNIMGQESEAGKAFALAQATINTYLGASKAIAQGGTNDILSGIRVTHLEKMMLSEINKLNKKIPLCIGIPPLMTPLSITTGWQTHFAFTKNNKDLKNYGSFLKANCIDLDILFIDFSTAFPLDNTWYSDGIHPNEKGYSKFADITAPYMSI